MAVSATSRDGFAVVRMSVKQDVDQRLVRLGEGVRSLREAAGLSQEALAGAAGIDRSHMSRIERGKRNVSFLNICRIAEALGTPPSALLIAGSL